MASSLKCGLSISGSNGVFVNPKAKGDSGFCDHSSSLQFNQSKSKDFPTLSTDFLGNPQPVSDRNRSRYSDSRAPRSFSVRAQASICVSRALRWWDKTLKPNMVEIVSAQHLADSLVNAGDRLVVVDFYSPGCGGCRALHPKICQLAESNPDAIFLKVNYEELKTMCKSLHVHVLPFFRMYRGAEGRVCSFSCTNASIKKFKDALAKYGTERCSLGPAKGLDEAELIRLASDGEISTISPLTSQSSTEDMLESLVMPNLAVSGLWGNDRAVLMA